MTQAQYTALMIRRAILTAPVAEIDQGPFSHDPPESDLHDYIIKRCRELGWPYGHGSMAHRTRYVEGFPDFVIFHGGPIQPKVLLIECKTKIGKLSPAQRAFAASCAKVGHCVHVVRSEQEFEELIK